MKEIDFNEVINDLKGGDYSPVPDLVYINVPDAKNVLYRGLIHMVGNSAKWLPEYENVAAWLENNNGRGLLCLGNCGRGKTLICSRILPLLLKHYYNKILSCYGAQAMNAHIDEVIAKHLIYIDDIGTEGYSVKYGERRLAFSEICDEAEKKGKLLIVSTNLNLDQIKAKYGERTIDRLKAITIPILFTGESLRG